MSKLKTNKSLLTKFIQYLLLLLACNISAGDSPATSPSANEEADISRRIKAAQENQYFHILTDESAEDICTVELSGEITTLSLNLKFHRAINLNSDGETKSYFKDFEDACPELMLLQKVTVKNIRDTVLLDENIDLKCNTNEYIIRDDCDLNRGYTGKFIHIFRGIMIYLKRGEFKHPSAIGNIILKGTPESDNLQMLVQKMIH